MVTLSNRTADMRHHGPSPLRTVSLSASGILDSSIQAHLGQQLQTWYGNPAEEKLPYRLTRLLNRLTDVIRARTEPVDQVFADGILASVTSLRAFAVSLTRNADQAEDLVQETVLRAISKHEQFAAGTNLQAWLFTILRNQFHTSFRKRRREVEDPDGIMAGTLSTLPEQEGHLDMSDLQKALAQLSVAHREVLLLIGAEGLSYEETAHIVGANVGTVKSRMNRARARLAELLHVKDDDDLGTSRVIRAALAADAGRRVGLQQAV